MWCENQLDLMQVLTVVLSDNRPSPSADATYLFGNTPDMEKSIIARGALLYRAGRARKLHMGSVYGGGPYIPPQSKEKVVAYSGFEAWKKTLENLGVDSGDILDIPFPPGLVHTGTESEGLVALAKQESWSSLAIVAWPGHLLRAFTNTVTFAVRSYPELKVYAVPGIAQPWNERATSSQGIAFGTRRDAIGGELDRLNRWHAKGNLVSCNEVLKYLARRDSKVFEGLAWRDSE